MLIKRIYKAFIAISFFVLLVFSPVFIWGMSCVKIFDSRLSQAWKIDVFREIEEIRNSRFNEILVNEGHRYYEGDPVKLKGDFFTPPLRSVQNFTVSKWLGRGEEGEVFLVQSENGKLFVLKKFFEKNEAIENYETIENVQAKMPHAVVAPLAFNSTRGLLLSEYIPGEALYDVLSSASLPKTVREQLNKDFDKMVNQAIENGFFGITEANVLVQKSDLRLFIVDPY